MRTEEKEVIRRYSHKNTNYKLFGTQLISPNLSWKIYSIIHHRKNKLTLEV